MTEPVQAPARPFDERRWRLWAATIASAGWVGLIVETVLVFGRLHGWAPTAWRLAGFFTIISNLTIACLFTAIALGMKRLRHPLLIAGAAMTMALVGAVFELMLRRDLHLSGWRLVSNALLHDAVPLLTVAAWLSLAEKGRLRRRDPWLIAIFPIVYLGYALVRGAVSGWYPYPFVDPAKVGWLGVTLYVIGISAVFLGVGHMMVLLDTWLARRSARQR